LLPLKDAADFLLTILFAGALQAVKLLSLAAAFNAINSLAIPRGLCLAVLGVAAAVYSPTAELSLVIPIA
jgi:hypothetical protein